MNRIKATGSGSYQAARDINVTNIFGKTQDNYMSWIAAIGRCVDDSIIVFNHDLRVIYMNNAWGTFNSSRRVKTIRDVVKQIEHLYYNPQILELAVEECARFMETRTSCLHMLNGLDVICRCQPVLDQGLMCGVILGAWKQDTTTRPKKATSTLRIAK